MKKFTLKKNSQTLRCITAALALTTAMATSAQQVKTYDEITDDSGVKYSLYATNISANHRYISGQATSSTTGWTGIFVLDTETNAFAVNEGQTEMGGDLRGVSNDGVAVGYNPNALTLSIDGTMTELETPAGYESSAYDTSNDGKVVTGAYWSPNDYEPHACIWNDGKFITLPEEYRDTYRELILFPVQAMSNLYQMYYAQAMNNRLYQLGDPAANLWADRVAEAFRRDSMLCAQYNHDIAGGKWNGMMIQKHIGYTDWHDNFERDMMPEVHRIDGNAHGGFTHKAAGGYVAMEAEHYFSKADGGEAAWTVIPYMGRTLSGISLQQSTLDFLNKGGLTYSVALDGGGPQTVNFNKNLNEEGNNTYTVYYPTVARRVVESVVTLPLGNGHDGTHELVITPNDPGIVFEKIVVDMGGYKPSYLFMDASVKERTKP